MQRLKIDLTGFQSSEIAEISNLLSPYTNRAYFVGGCVRDRFLGIKSSDFDIEVYDISEQKFERLMSKIGASGYGKSFFVYKYKNIDISLPRTENKISIGHKGFNVKICDDEKTASKRRDFTMNSLMINIFSGEILDFWGGLNDIKSRKIRIICEKSFLQDSLRVLRAVQFAARFNFKIEKNSLEMMKKMDLSDLSVDRIRMELIKLFRAKFQHIGLKYIYELNLSEFLFGINLDEKLYKKISNLLKTGAKFIQNEMFFLYIFINLSGVNARNLLKRLNLGCVYKRLENEPFLLRATALNLAQISLKMPLCNWLGLYTKKRECNAKKLGIYEAKFDAKIDTKKLLEQGFMGEKIGKEIKRLENLAIRNFINLKAKLQ